MLLRFLLRVIRPFATWLLRIDRTGVQKIDDKHVLLIGPHTSLFDAYLLADAALPLTFRPLANAYYFHLPFFNKVLRLCNAIPKKLFTRDAAPVMSALRAAKAGNSIAVFPSGRVSFDGTDFPLASPEGLAKFIKKLGLAVWAYRCDGIYLSRPKWRSAIRRVPCKVYVERVLTAEEVRDLPATALITVVENVLRVDESRSLRALPQETLPPCDISGITSVLFMCPKCLAAHTLHENASRDSLSCSACGTTFMFDRSYYWHACEAEANELSDAHPISLWNRMQIDTLRARGTDFSSSGTAYCFANERDKKPTPVGTGTITIKGTTFTYSGTLYSDALTVSYTPQTLEALAMACRDAVELYYEGELIRFRPDNPEDVIELALRWDIVSCDTFGKPYPSI